MPIFTSQQPKSAMHSKKNVNFDMNTPSHSLRNSVRIAKALEGSGITIGSPEYVDEVIAMEKKMRRDHFREKVVDSKRRSWRKARADTPYPAGNRPERRTFQPRKAAGRIEINGKVVYAQELYERLLGLNIHEGAPLPAHDQCHQQ